MIRRGLMAAGFQVEKRPGFGCKRDMLAGVYQGEAAPESQPYAPRCTAATDRIAVIGGGIAAGHCLLSLQQRQGFADVFCEDETVAQGASGNAQGAIYPLLNADDDVLNQWFIQAFLWTRQRLQSLQQRSPFKMDFSGVLQLAFDASHEKKLAKMLADPLCKTMASAVDASQASALSGVHLTHGGAWLPEGGWVCAEALTQACFAATQDHHRLYTSCHIVKCTQDETKAWWLWDAKGQKYGPYDAVIMANGASSTQFEQTEHLPMTRVRGQVNRMPSTTALQPLKTVLCASGYLTPAFEGLHCYGASYNRKDLSNQISLQEQQDNQARIQKSFASSSWIHDFDSVPPIARASVRMVSRDHMPFIGSVFQEDQNGVLASIASVVANAAFIA